MNLPFYDLLSEYGDSQFPDKGLGDCCISAVDTLRNIEEEVVAPENKAYHLRKLQAFASALSARLEEIDQQSSEGVLLEVSIRYLGLVEDFLKIRDVPPYELRDRDESLDWYGKAFNGLLEHLDKLGMPARTELETRIRLAEEWCYRRRDLISHRPQEMVYSHQPAIRASSEPLSNWSFWLGVIGIVTFLPAIPAVMVGRKALAKINRANGALRGKGEAVCGIVFGYLGLAMGAFWLLAVLIKSISRLKQLI